MSEKPHEGNADQARYWASAVGAKWVELQEPLDLALQQVSAVLFERAKPASGEQVLDLGCGTGATTLDLAERVGPKGRVAGLDISPVLLERARARTPTELAPRIDWVEADAQTHDFGLARYDLLVSRFGSMFFSDPVAAFRNLRSGLRRGARLYLAAWAPLAANPWFRIPLETAVARLGPPPAADPKAPGPMAFADTAYVLGLLRSAGFAQPAVETVEVLLTPPGDAQAAARLALSIGPAVRLLSHYEGTPADAEAIGRAMLQAFTPYERGGQIRVPATIHLFAATAP